MKNLIKCVGVVGCVAGAYAYMLKNGVPALGNITMKLPVQPKYGLYDIYDKVMEHVTLPF